MFEHPTYVVLELPPLVGASVLNIRKRYDLRLASFPAEITVAGSSGIGTLAPNQDACAALQSFRQLVDEHLPIATRFIGISRFASGPAVWLQPENPAPFAALQQSLINSGIQFQPHKFPYTPHCSLCTSSLTPELLEALLLEGFPQEMFELTTLALYKVVQGNASLVRRFQPKPGPNNSVRSFPSTPGA